MLATDNPIEYEGTYELPEAQLDRFLMRLRLGYLSTGDETAMLRRRVDRAREYVELNAVTSADGVLAMRDSLEQVEITPDLLDYIVAIVGATRNDAQVQVGASPRGGLALVQLARGQALLSSRDYVVPDDIKQVAVPALAHRVTLRPELWVRQVSSDDVMAKLLSSVPTPKTDPARGTRRPGSGPSPADVVRACSPNGPALAAASTELAASLAIVPARPAAAHARPGRRCSSPSWPAARSSRAWPRPRCCCWRPGAAQRRPPRITVRAQPSTRRAFEGELLAVDVTIEGQGECSVRWRLHPGREIAPVGATAADGPQARFTFTPRALGAAADRHAGRGAARPLAAGRRARDHDPARLDCYPAPAQQRTRSCSGGCRTGSASTRPGPPARASSSPACASTCRATGSAASTGRPAPGAGGCR